MKTHIPGRFNYSILAQICKLIPPHAAPNLARKHKVDEQWRRFNPWSHVVAWMQAHLSHSIGLLLRYLAHLHSWGHSFIRHFTVLRAAMWKHWSLADLMILYGTATCEITLA